LLRETILDINICLRSLNSKLYEVIRLLLSIGFETTLRYIENLQIERCLTDGKPAVAFKI
jgi:hypothetical protein